MFVDNGEVADAIKDEMFRYAKQNMALVNVYIKDPVVTRIKRDQKIPIIGFVANTGGLLGLCMGFSLISAFEIIFHCMISIRKMYLFLYGYCTRGIDAIWKYRDYVRGNAVSSDEVLGSASGASGTASTPYCNQNEAKAVTEMMAKHNGNEATAILLSDPRKNAVDKQNVSIQLQHTSLCKNEAVPELVTGNHIQSEEAPCCKESACICQNQKGCYNSIQKGNVMLSLNSTTSGYIGDLDNSETPTVTERNSCIETLPNHSNLGLPIKNIQSFLSSRCKKHKKTNKTQNAQQQCE